MSKKPGTRDTLSDRDLQKETKLARQERHIRERPIPEMYEDDLIVDEPSAVHDMSQEMVWQAVGRVEKWAENTAKAINAQGQFVKAIHKKTEEALRAAERSRGDVRVVSTKLDAVDSRVGRLADKVDEGHSCVFGDETVPKLQELVHADIQHGVRAKERIAAVEKGLDEHKSTAADVSKESRAARRSGRLALLGIAASAALTVGTAAVGVVYGYGRFTERVEDVDDDIEEIQTDIEQINQKVNPESLVNSMKAVEEAVRTSSETRFDHMCDDMSSWEKRRVRELLKGQQVPPSCLEE